MKIYDIITETKTNEAVRIPGLDKVADVVSGGIKMGKDYMRIRKVLQRLEPFIESSSDKYAEAVIAARKSGKAADPNPYAVFKKEMESSGLQPDEMKAVLDEISKRAQPKIKAGGVKPAETPSPKDASKPKEEPPKKREPEVKPKEEPVPNDRSDKTRDSDSDWLKNEKIPREKIGEYFTVTMYEKVVGNTANLFKYFGIWELSFDYWQDLQYYKKQRDENIITEDQYRVRIRMATSGFVAKLMTFGLALRLSRWILSMKGPVMIPSFFVRLASLGFADKVTGHITSIVLTEAVISYFAKDVATTDGMDEAISSAVIYIIDPVVAKIWNETAGKVMPSLIFDTLEDAIKKAKMVPDQTANTTNTTNTTQAAGQTAPAQSAPQSGQREPEPAVGQGPADAEFDRLMKDTPLRSK